MNELQRIIYDASRILLWPVLVAVAPPEPSLPPVPVAVAPPVPVLLAPPLPGAPVGGIYELPELHPNVPARLRSTKPETADRAIRVAFTLLPVECLRTFMTFSPLAGPSLGSKRWDSAVCW